jgi:hypothetical protein
MGNTCGDMVDIAPGHGDRAPVTTCGGQAEGDLARRRELAFDYTQAERREKGEEL